MKRQVLFVFGSQACVPDDPLIAAQGMGCETAVFSAAVPCGVTAVDRYERVDVRRPQQAVAAARALNRAHSIHAVVGYDDQAVPVVARIADALGLPGHPIEAADAAQDKLLMKERFAAAGIPIAPFTLAEDEDDAVRWAGENGYPVVVKPVRGSASQGVIRAGDEEALRAAYRRLRRIVDDYGIDTGVRGNARQLVEGYLDGGREVSVELLIRDGAAHVVCLFDKPKLLDGTYFEESIYVTPTRLDPPLVEQISDLAVRACTALGLKTGAAHCEVRLTSSGPKVLEIAARVIGGACSRVFRGALGEDIHPYVVRLALGEEIAWPRPRDGASGAMMLPIPGEGRLRAVRGAERAGAVAGIDDVIVTATPGDIIVPFPEQSCYLGFLTARGDSPEAVTATLETAAGRIEMDLDPVGCLTWRGDVGPFLDYRPPERYGIRSLGDLGLDEARDIVVPLVAAIHFGEYPPELSIAKAQACVASIAAGERGETQPGWWLVTGAGVALGSRDGDTCFSSCLGVLPEARGTGLGPVLLKSIMGHFARLGCRHVQALVDPRQPAMNRVVRRLGFALAGDADETNEANEPSCCVC